MGGPGTTPGERMLEPARVPGAGPEGSPRAPGPDECSHGENRPRESLFRAEPLFSLSPLPGQPQMSQSRVDDSADTKALVGSWCCVLFGFGFFAPKPVKPVRPSLKLELLVAPSTLLAGRSQEGCSKPLSPGHLDATRSQRPRGSCSLGSSGDHGNDHDSDSALLMAAHEMSSHFHVIDEETGAERLSLLLPCSHSPTVSGLGASRLGCLLDVPVPSPVLVLLEGRRLEPLSFWGSGPFHPWGGPVAGRHLPSQGQTSLLSVTP